LALRMLESHVPPDLAEEARQILGEVSHECWVQDGGRFGSVVFAVMGSEQTGGVMDRLHAELSNRGGLLVLVQPLDGMLPRPFASSNREARADARSAAAVSREEGYARIADTPDSIPCISRWWCWRPSSRRSVSRATTPPR